MGDAEARYRAVNIVPFSRNHGSKFIFYDLTSLRKECLINLRNRPRIHANSRIVHTFFQIPPVAGRQPLPNRRPCPSRVTPVDSISIIAQMFHIDEKHRLDIDIVNGTATMSRGIIYQSNIIDFTKNIM